MTQGYTPCRHSTFAKLRSLLRADSVASALDGVRRGGAEVGRTVLPGGTGKTVLFSLAVEPRHPTLMDTDGCLGSDAEILPQRRHVELHAGEPRSAVEISEFGAAVGVHHRFGGRSEDRQHPPTH